MTSYHDNAANELTLETPPSGAPATVCYDENGNTLVENTGGQLTTHTWDSENLATRGRLKDCQAGRKARNDLLFHQQYPTRKRGEVTNRVKP
ncbi:MAG: hypothetical protein HY321_20745, partial [Armatimonadetes bacterium]|nr:hypothetical protein [Armatimonadota bacterium]